MKKQMLVLIVMLFCAIFLITTGCATGKLDRHSGLERPLERPEDIRPLQKTADSQVNHKLDQVILSIDKLARAITSKKQAAMAKKPTADLFKKPAKRKFGKKSPRKSDAANARMLKNHEYRLRNLEGATLEQAMMLLSGEYGVIDRIGDFRSGGTELECNRRGCDLKAQIKAALTEREKAGYALKRVIGFSFADGNAMNKKIGKSRAVSVLKEILYHRKDYKGLEPEYGGETSLFGKKAKNRCVILVWSK